MHAPILLDAVQFGVFGGQRPGGAACRWEGGEEDEEELEGRVIGCFSDIRGVQESRQRWRRKQ
jgi:hypothetical protein